MDEDDDEYNEFIKKAYESHENAITGYWFVPNPSSKEMWRPTRYTYSWVYGGIKVTDKSKIKDIVTKIKVLEYDYISRINAFLYCIDTKGIIKVETESRKYFIDIALAYEDGISIDTALKRVKQGIEEFEKLTNNKVETVFKYEAFDHKDHLFRKKRTHKRVKIIYQIQITENIKDNDLEDIRTADFLEEEL